MRYWRYFVGIWNLITTFFCFSESTSMGSSKRSHFPRNIFPGLQTRSWLLDRHCWARQPSRICSRIQIDLIFTLRRSLRRPPNSRYHWISYQTQQSHNSHRHCAIHWNVYTILWKSETGFKAQSVLCGIKFSRMSSEIAQRSCYSRMPIEAERSHGW